MQGSFPILNGSPCGELYSQTAATLKRSLALTARSIASNNRGITPQSEWSRECAAMGRYLRVKQEARGPRDERRDLTAPRPRGDESPYVGPLISCPAAW